MHNSSNLSNRKKLLAFVVAIVFLFGAYRFYNSDPEHAAPTKPLPRFGTSPPVPLEPPPPPTTLAPTAGPPDEATNAPTDPPSSAPTDQPSGAPSDPPSSAPSDPPSSAPSDPPSNAPTATPTEDRDSYRCASVDMLNARSVSA
jgi:hypothetical protein